MRAELGSLECTIESGTVISRVQARQPEEAGIPVKVLLPKALCGGIDAELLEEIRVDEALLRAGKVKFAQRDDVIVKLTTPYDVAHVSERDAGIVISSHCVIIRSLRPEEIDARYLAYALSSPYGRDYMSSVSSGAATAMLKVRDIASFPLPLLPPREQRMLGEIYKAFEEKRIALRRMLAAEEASQDILIMEAIGRELDGCTYMTD